MKISKTIKATITALSISLAAACTTTRADIGYLIVNPSNTAVSKTEGSTYSISTSIGVKATGIPSVPNDYSIQTIYYISGTAIYGTHYRIKARASKISSYTYVNVAPNPNGETRSFPHTTIRNGPSAENNIVIEILNNSLQESTKTLVLERSASHPDLESNVHIEVRIKDNDLVASSTSSISNLSTRGVVGDGHNVMIGGFVVSGSSPKTLLIRGMGPTLASYGVSNVISDPNITLYNSSGSAIAGNNNWGDAPNQSSISATGYAPGNSAESAILTDLQPSIYTVFLNNLSSGRVGLFELYDMSGGYGSKLVNVSTRAYAGSGDEVLIAGFVITGGPKRVLITAKGPVLAQYGISGAMSNPRLTLHNSSGAVLEDNESWKSAWNYSAIAGTPYAPTYDAEAAIMEVLPAGVYTAILSGSSGAGVALVEVYDL